MGRRRGCWLSCDRCVLHAPFDLLPACVFFLIACSLQIADTFLLPFDSFVLRRWVLQDASTSAASTTRRGVIICNVEMHTRASLTTNIYSHAVCAL
jgi:hypothetical protein